MQEPSAGENIFVGNLSTTTTETALRTLFAPFGEVVSVQVVVDRDTGVPRGFAFVEMRAADEAAAAVAALNDTVLDDRPLRINLARPKELERDNIHGNMRRHRDHRT